MLILSRMGYWTRTEWWNYCYSCFLKELWGSSLDRAGRARPQLRLYAISCLPADVDTCQQHQPCPLTLGKKQEKKRTFKENLILKKIDLYWKRWTPRNSPYQLRVRICFTDIQVVFSDALRSLPHWTLNPIRCTVLWNFHENVITLGVEDFGNTLSFYEIDWSGELRRNPLSLLDFSYYTHFSHKERVYRISMPWDQQRRKKRTTTTTQQHKDNPNVLHALCTSQGIGM